MEKANFKNLLGICFLCLFAAQHHPAIPGNLIDDDHVDLFKCLTHLFGTGINDAGQDQMAVICQPAGQIGRHGNQYISHDIGQNDIIRTVPGKLIPQAFIRQQIAAAGIARAGVSAATVVVLMLPPMILFLILQSNVVETMAHSGLKD